LIEPYATAELSEYSFLSSANEFYQAVEQLNERAENSAEAVDTYSDSQ